jgi:hypothetical protein
MSTSDVTPTVVLVHGALPAHNKEKTMPELRTVAFRTVGPSAIPKDSVVPMTPDDRKRRISIARVDDCLYAFDDLCTCAGHAASAWGGEADG